jgi:hypothetical protein
MTQDIALHWITSLPWCNVCGKPVERFGLSITDEIVPAVFPGMVLVYEFTGWCTWRYEMQCHGESFVLEKQVYDPEFRGSPIATKPTP